MSVQIAQAAPPIQPNAHWPDSTKELGYQLWAFIAGRNAKEVARLLASGEHGDPVNVPHTTLCYWAREYGWAERVDREIQAIAPDLRRQAFSELMLAAIEGAKYLHRVARGLEDAPNVSDILADDTLDAAAKQAKVDSRHRWHNEARKARLQAAIAAKDSIGLAPGAKGAPAIEPPKSDDAEDCNPERLVGMTPAELMREEERWRARKGTK